MDSDRPEREAALRTRADEAITAALAAADDSEPSLDAVLADSTEAIALTCSDDGLPPGDRLALLDDGLRLLASLKALAGAAQSARPMLLARIYRRSNDLLRRYARLVRAGARRPPERGGDL
ncbi:MAG TPA: hypothetical protein VH309_05490 [Elusimicrobiota bacterium]|jgi:hypothetical protein|nr:hypothetical protein [Elusimicrobiota bacterium]